jgi:hypothetical protein
VTPPAGKAVVGGGGVVVVGVGAGVVDVAVDGVVVLDGDEVAGGAVVGGAVVVVGAAVVGGSEVVVLVVGAAMRAAVCVEAQLIVSPTNVTWAVMLWVE